MHVTRCTTSRSLGISPGALVFRRDMFLELPIIADLLQIQQNRQALINENLRRQNIVILSARSHKTLHFRPVWERM